MGCEEVVDGKEDLFPPECSLHILNYISRNKFSLHYASCLQEDLASIFIHGWVFTEYINFYLFDIPFFFVVCLKGNSLLKDTRELFF